MHALTHSLLAVAQPIAEDPLIGSSAADAVHAPEVASAWFVLLVRLTLSVLALAMVVAALRLFRGPALPDRVVALDLLSTVIVGSVAVYAIESDQPVMLHVGIALAILMFLGTVAFALYLEKGAPK